MLICDIKTSNCDKVCCCYDCLDMSCKYRCGLDYDDCEHKKVSQVGNGLEFIFTKKDESNEVE